jgi:hypothetical protein
VVECNLAKVDVEGSNPFSRSRYKLLHAWAFGKDLRVMMQRWGDYLESVSADMVPTPRLRESSGARCELLSALAILSS